MLRVLPAGARMTIGTVVAPLDMYLPTSYCKSALIGDAISASKTIRSRATQSDGCGPQLRRLLDHGGRRLEQEVHRHRVAHSPAAAGRKTHRGAGEPELRDAGVDETIRAELGVEPGGVLVAAAALARAFAEVDCVGVATELLGDPINHPASNQQSAHEPSRSQGPEPEQQPEQQPEPEPEPEG